MHDYDLSTVIFTFEHYQSMKWVADDDSEIVWVGDDKQSNLVYSVGISMVNEEICVKKLMTEKVEWEAGNAELKFIQRKTTS